MSEVLRMYQYMPVAVLQPEVDRKLMYVRKNRRRIIMLDNLDPALEGPQFQPKDAVDVSAQTPSYRNTLLYLGIQEMTWRRIRAFLDGTNFSLVEETPSVRNIWVGEDTKLYTPEEAKQIPHKRQTALISASRWQSTPPEMVVRAKNGEFYPATINDIVINQPN